MEMTRDQKGVLHLVLEGASIFIGGEAGTGKSFLLVAIASALSRKGLRVAVTASTGIAALNIGGNTFHSELGIPLPTPDDIIDAALSKSRQDRSCYNDDDAEDVSGETEDDAARSVLVDSIPTGSCSPSRQPQRLQFKNTEVLTSVDVIVLDEVSMLHAGFLEALDRALRRTSGRDARRPFGGVQMILSGDFMQLTPFASLDRSFGSSRRSPRTLSDEAYHCNRKVCRGVQRPLSESASDFKLNTEHSNGANGSKGVQAPATDSSSTAFTGSFQVSPESSSLNDRVQQCGRIPRRKKEIWYYDKPMFESWCFRKHLLHVQLRDPQRQKDASFAADLNELRRGELPFRLSRSAFLNSVDEDAVRLLPTKAAVKNFNDRRMLELGGESRLFRTQLTVTDATAVAALTQRPSQQQGDVKSTYSCRSVLLVQYRLRSPSKAASCAGAFGRKYLLTSQELRRTERHIERQCKLPPQSLRLRALPVPLSYSTSLRTLSLECNAASAAVAGERRAAVKAALEQYIIQQGVEAAPPSCSLESVKKSPMQCSLLFPREIVRLEPVEWLQILRRLQPAMQQAFRDAIRKDTVLQDKTFKLGCRVMLLRNLSTTYVNGSLGTITRYLPVSECASLMPADMKATTAPHLTLPPTTAVMKNEQLPLRDDTAVLPVVRMDADGKEVAIPWIVLPVPVVHHDWCYLLRATCVPLTPAYAFTVHKIQGVTLNHAVLFDADGMFPCDHLVYVAASRVREFAQLRIINLTPGMISVHVPSLQFTNQIPTVQTARQTWDAWRDTPNSNDSLFLPSYTQAQQPYACATQPVVNADIQG
ncbi:putative mitochondrial DNA repair and recombination helicase protein PIF4 [Leptomonas pyrrhocoris]|uniref:ATP-dependent DNA helicase n=1 Tax=Leptomonas pyrrhocoris TaxID=157538 RepID=A0A0M9G8J6_LEPPY|nr:putative mitochondrial DNA repair and recombination helicase protein PIF4 [Leptomonas pyrrhocoris]KPA84706.1 putative mitochondrial DNA repair and recombination helicase protein PIF4 [Leptomonas pyrrhocoris]|eukprot:XP_015663145.1 putative mitochondrial DNA repair and recombination helicase protein PIF4 [Leptomonas pyrrhocoris]